MKHSSIIAKKEREEIFKLFIKRSKLKFSDIEKKVKIRSNHLNYHIERMVEENILEKADGFYNLTKNAEKMIPFFAHVTGKEQGPLTIITAAIINRGKICLLKRAKRPYQGYWGLIGGKLKLEESIKESALRESKEETGLNCKFEKVAAVLHERVRDSGIIKHAFTIFFCKLSTKETKTRKPDEGELEWFDIDDLPEKIIPSDKIMIQDLLEGDFCSKDVLIDDKEGELVDMVVKDGGSI